MSARLGSLARRAAGAGVLRAGGLRLHGGTRGVASVKLASAVRKRDDGARQVGADALRDALHKRHVNKTAAMRADDYFPVSDIVDAPAQSQPEGQGSWRSWTPTAMLRSVFDRMADNLRVTARGTGSSHGHLGKVRMMCAEVIRSEAINGYKRIAELPNLRHVVLNWLSDESSFVVKASDGGPPDVAPILNQHGILSWRCSGDPLEREEIIVAPKVMADKTAHTVHGAFESVFPEWKNMLKAGDGGAILLSTDSAQVNFRWAWVVADLLATEPMIPVLLIPCMQHLAALTLRQATDLLALLCPLFCLIQYLHSQKLVPKMLKIIEGILQAELDFIDARGEAVDEDNERFHDEVLERCLYSINCMNPNFAVDEQAAYRARDGLRREQGKRVKRFLMASGATDVRSTGAEVVARIVHKLLRKLWKYLGRSSVRSCQFLL